MTDKEIERFLKIKSEGLFLKNKNYKNEDLSEYQEDRFFGIVLDYINRLKTNLESAIQSFTKMETLYKVKCNELEVIEEKIRKETAKEICNWLFKNAYFSEDITFAKSCAEKFGVELEEK